MTHSAYDDDDDPLVPPGAVAPMPVPTTGKQRALLALVIILGVLILLGFAALVVGLITGVAGKGRTATGARAASDAYSSTLDLPAGAHVASTQLSGDRVLIHLVSPDGEEIILIDAHSGAIVGRIQVKPPP